MAFALLACAMSQAPASAAEPQSVRVVGTDLHLTLDDGQVLRNLQLRGVELDLGVARLRVDDVMRDPRARTGDVWLFSFSVAGADGAWQQLCEADPDGQRLAMPLPASAQGSFALTCSGGAIGKCIRFGYRPWALAPDGVTPLAPYHAACVNLVRAAYGGPARGWTRNGMPIDLYDDIGIQQPEGGAAMPFEAGWTPEGAACVAHTRVAEHGGLAELGAAYPALADRLGPDRCDEASARAAGAILFNRSPVGGR